MFASHKVIDMTPNNKPLFGTGTSARPTCGKTENARPYDLRRSERVTGFKNGKITLASGLTMDCIVRNYSDHGCLITCVNAETLPEDVSIQLDALKPTRPARVVWRDQGVAGLEFQNSPLAAGDLPPRVR